MDLVSAALVSAHRVALSTSLPSTQIDGHPAFRALSRALAFGADSPGVKEKRIATVQALSGEKKGCAAQGGAATLALEKVLELIILFAQC